MLKLYVLISVICSIAVISGADILIRRASIEYGFEYKIGEFLLSSNAVQLLLVSFIPIINVMLAFVFIFLQDILYVRATKVAMERINSIRK